VCGVTQAVLDRRGIGRIEDRGDSPTTLVLMLVSIPLTALSTMGVLVISLWSLFKLPLIPTVAVLIAGFVVYGLVLGNVYARIQRSELALAALYAFGLPAVLATRTVATIGAIYLTITFLR
jgi:hypothetical protein